jgi:hypothetical protein
MSNFKDFSKKYNVGDVVIFKLKTRNFKDSIICRHQLVKDLLKRTNNNISKTNVLLKPYLVKHKPFLTCSGVGKIVKIEDEFSDFVFYSLDSNNQSGEQIMLTNVDVVDALSMGDKEYLMFKQIAESIAFIKLLKILKIRYVR